eukprot:3132236-Prymnesium_polylepis.1
MLGRGGVQPTRQVVREHLDQMPTLVRAAQERVRPHLAVASAFGSQHLRVVHLPPAVNFLRLAFATLGKGGAAAARVGLVIFSEPTLHSSTSRHRHSASRQSSATLAPPSPSVQPKP